MDIDKTLAWFMVVGPSAIVGAFLGYHLGILGVVLSGVFGFAWGFLMTYVLGDTLFRGHR